MTDTPQVGSEDEGQMNRTPTVLDAGQTAVREAEVGDVVEVADRERGRRRHQQATGEYEVRERLASGLLKVYRLDGGGWARMQEDAVGDGVRVLTGDGSDPGVVWHEATVRSGE